MSAPLPVCYLNGTYLPLADARVSPLDRAFLFGDAVYEVIPVYAARPFRLAQHLHRLDRSLAQIRMPPPRSQVEWSEVCEQLVARNAAQDSYLYIQVTRGVEFGRSHAWPEGLTPTVFAYATALEALAPAILAKGVAAVTAADTRWARRDIKSTALLANILLKKLSSDAGAYETIMIEDGQLTEGSSTTVHTVKNGMIVTPPNGHRILPGTTRDVVTELAERLGVPCESTAVTEDQLRAADEIWLAFATRGVLPVTTLDGARVGSGEPGPLFRRISAGFSDYIRELQQTRPL